MRSATASKGQCTLAHCCVLINQSLISFSLPSSTHSSERNNSNKKRRVTFSLETSQLGDGDDEALEEAAPLEIEKKRLAPHLRDSK